MATVPLALAIGLLISVGLGAAQEELPPPRPAPAPAPTPAPAPERAPQTPAIVPAPPLPPRLLPPTRDPVRNERRERLRAIGNQVFEALAQPANGGAADAPPLLDITRLNAGLKPLVVELLGGAEAVESLHVAFIPEGTNFAEDRLRLAADAVLRRTAWADAPSRANLTLGAQVARSEAGAPVALIDGQLRLETSTVALTNYAVAQYKAKRAERAKKASAAPAPAAPATAAAKDPGDELFAQLLDERLASVGRLETLDDVADLLTAVSGLRLTAVSQRIEQLRDQARAATDPDAQRSLETQLAKVRADRDRLFDVRPRIERSPDGRAQLIALGMVGSELFPGAEMRQMELRLTEGEVSLDAAGAMTRYVEFYPLVKPVIINVLVRIQNGDARALEGLRAIINGMLGAR